MGKITWKFNDEIANAIIEMVSKGHSRTGAGLVCGITAATMCEWMKKGRLSKSGKYNNFYNNIKKAEGTAAVVIENIVYEEAKDKDAKSHMTAAIFWLKCRMAREWSERLIHEMQGEVDVKHEHSLKDYSKLSEEELQKQFNSILKTGKIPEEISMN